MSIGRALINGRRQAEARMRGRCVITRYGTWETDPDGNASRPESVIYEGKGYARYPGLAFEQNSDSQGANVVQSRLVYRIPFGPIIRPDDVVEIISDPDNPQLAGVRLRVASIDDQSQATAQRLLTEDNQQGVA